ncbi:MAG: ATP-binding cassette domain-containing protein [Alphaproteobacteria bacterium]
MPEPDELLVFSGVDKSFGHQRALHSVSFTISAGELGVLVGPAQSGKTTIIRLSSGVDRPDDGSVLFDGVDSLNVAASAPVNIGSVFGDAGLDRSRSVRSNLRFAANIYGVRVRPAKARMAALLARFNLTAYERDDVGSLGDVGQRLIAIAQAVLHRPRLLLMDAIADGLDPGGRRELLEVIGDLCVDEKMAVLWATQHADDAATADRLIVLGRGRVVFEGAPTTLLINVGQDSLSAAISLLGERHPAR